MRGAVTMQGIEFCVEECYSCGTPFAFSQTLERNFRDNKIVFYCPNGHSQSYVRPLREVLEQTRRDRDEAIAARDRVEASLANLKKRVASGTCGFCKRHFVNVWRHMQTKHPKVAP